MTAVAARDRPNGMSRTLQGCGRQQALAAACRFCETGNGMEPARFHLSICRVADVAALLADPRSVSPVREKESERERENDIQRHPMKKDPTTVLEHGLFWQFWRSYFTELGTGMSAEGTL